MKNYLDKYLIHFKAMLLVAFFCAGFAGTALAQDSKGTEFWICFPGNQQSPSPELYITGEQASVVTVDIPGIAFNQVVNVPAGDCR
ncbi:MAG: hypothetical protein IPP72_22275 [Chitinophagaceae bacterium]|nr:hypothetical protein [Chitinophagaceae bacterium]